MTSVGVYVSHGVGGGVAAPASVEVFHRPGVEVAWASVGSSIPAPSIGWATTPIVLPEPGGELRIDMVHSAEHTIISELSIQGSCVERAPCLPGSGSVSACAATDCATILADGHSTGDGTYWIDPSASGAFQVHCDMTTDDGGWTLIAQGGSLSCTSMEESTSMRGVDACSYLAYDSVQAIADSASTVRLHVGYESSRFGSWSQTALSTNSLAVEAFESPTGTWHNGATWDNWNWNAICPSWATGWPNMYHGGCDASAVHWLTEPWDYFHDIRGGGVPRAQISANWLR